jgi:putative ABC transport system permease protein
MQSLIEAFRLAIRAIRSYKLRTALTLLGISVGILAIVLTFTLVDSLQYSISNNLSKLGNTVIYVSKWPWKDNSEDWYKYYRRPDMRYSDFQALDKRLEDVDAVGYFVNPRSRMQVSTRELDVENVKVTGITYDYARIMGLELGGGRYFSPLEVGSGRPVILLGYNVAEELFPRSSPLGRTVKLKGRRLRVVGVMAEQGANFFGSSADDQVYLPYKRMAQIFQVKDEGFNSNVIVRAASRQTLGTVEGQIIAVMRSVRGLRPGTENNFSLNKQEAVMNELNQIFDVLKVGGLFISIFALLVGGFGIANIMFVAVKERTKEIGMQKAIGATKRDILAQFLIEAVLLCLVGALVGIGIVVGALPALEPALQGIAEGLELVVSWNSISKGLMFAVLTGILAGFLPALSAARLNPVEAIRAGG